MTVFNNIFNVLLPYNSTHALFEFANRLKRQHLCLFNMALFSMGLYTHVGQAGIGGINQVQVSNYSPVPQDAVIAQPQMLLLVSDKHLNRPAFEITDYDGLGGQSEIVSHQRPILAFTFATCKNDFYLSKPLHRALAHSDTIKPCGTEPFDAVPATAVMQHIPSVTAQTSTDVANSKVAIGLCYTDIMPFTLLAGLDYGRAQVERIEQGRNSELTGKRRSSYGLGSQFGELAERQMQLTGVLLFDIKPAAPWDGDASIIETGLKNHVAFGVGSGRMQMDGSNGIHDFCPLESLSLVDDEEKLTVFLLAQTAEYIQCYIPHDKGFVPDSPPKKLTVICPVSRASQGLGKAIYSGSMTDGDSHNQSPEMLPSIVGEVVLKRFEKTLQFFGYFADCNHTASPTITIYNYKYYRLERPFLFDVYLYHDSNNRSV